MHPIDFENLELYAAQEPFSEGTIFLIKEKGKGPRRIVTALTFSEHPVGQYIKPSFTLSNDTVQQLFNRLWELGFRPKDGTGNSGHIAAITYHLEDMRELVFGNKEVVNIEVKKK